jgi:hypothetical protein
MSTETTGAIQVPAVSATTSGSILVRNEGGYVARFKVSYDPGMGQKRVHRSSGSFAIGAQKSIVLPSDATDISLKVEEDTGSTWSTIFTKSFAETVKKCYKVYGTTLNPKHKEIDCP